MQRYDLRHLGENFYDRMGELIESGLNVGEVGIFLFEVGDYSSIQKSADFIKDLGHDLMNSLKFNEVDWTIVVKRVDASTIAKAKEEAKAKAEEEAKAKAKEEAKTKVEEEAKAKAEEEAKAKAEEEAKTKVEKKPIVKKAPLKKPIQKKRATVAKKKAK